MQSGFVTTDETWHQKPLYSPDSRLYFVIGGSGMLLTDRTSLRLEPGYVYLAPCGAKCGFYGTDSVTKLFFHVKLRSESTQTDLFSNLDQLYRLPFDVIETERLKNLYLSTEPIDHLTLKSELFAVVSRFLEMGRDQLSQNAAHSTTVATAIGYITSHLSAKLTVAKVAQACFLSPSKLSLCFRNEVGQSVASYIDALLMSEACGQLCYTDRSIAKISERLGYCDQFYFSRAFRRHFGVSPLNYRKSKK